MERCAWNNTRIHEIDHNDDGDLKYIYVSEFFHVTKSGHEEINMFVARCDHAICKKRDSNLYNTHINI